MYRGMSVPGRSDNMLSDFLKSQDSIPVQELLKYAMHLPLFPHKSHESI